MEDFEEFDGLPLLQRKMAWDIFACDSVEELLPYMGLMPASKDVADLEHTESHERMDVLEPLVTLIETFVYVSSDLISRAMAIGAEAPEEAIDHLYNQNLEVIRGAVYSILAQLINAGTIEIVS